MVGSAAALTVEGGTPAGDVTVIAAVRNGKVVLAWPATATGYRLQRANALPAAAADWADEGTPAVQMGANWEVQLDPAGAKRFYRLIQ
jgi:hypothetical protein